MGKGKGIDGSHGKEKGQPVGYPFIMRLSISLGLALCEVCDRDLAWNAFHCLAWTISGDQPDARA